MGKGGEDRSESEKMRGEGREGRWVTSVYADPMCGVALRLSCC